MPRAEHDDRRRSALLRYASALACPVLASWTTGLARWSRRRRWITAAAILLLLFALDVARAPEKQWSARLLLSSIDLYQETLSPLMPSMGVQCRFTPTCSHYGEESIRKHGALVGTAKATWRVLRCGPWTAAGTEDPP